MYQFHEQLGAGCFGKVFKALDLTTYEWVAIKRIWIRDQGIRQQVLDEVHWMVDVIRHPSFVKCYDSYERRENNGHHYAYIVMTLASKGELYYRIPHGGYKEKVARSLFVDLLQGLAYLEDKKLVHRDLKLENVLVTSRNRLLIGDLGMATTERLAREEKQPCGSPLYMAPEVINKQGHSHVSDIWSCAIIFFSMITGQSPLKKEDILKHHYHLIRYDLVKKFSKELRLFLDAMLQTNPQHRWTAKQLLLHAWILGQSIPNPPPP